MEPRTEPPFPKSVLVVDDDPKSRRIIEVSLRSEGFDVQVAADAVAATAWLEDNVPGVIIAATALGDVDGFDFCRRVKEKPAHAQVPFMLLGEATAANRIRGIEIGAEEFVGKPVFIKDVVGRVSLLLQRQNRQRMETDGSGDQAFVGTLADISVVDLVQTLQGPRRSGVVHLRSQQSGSGEIYFRQGAVVDAEVGRLSGREAMFRLFSWSQGTYRIEPKSIRRKDAIGLPPAALVMEGMRRLDDWQRLLKDLPPLPTVFEVDYRVLAERLAEIPDEVNAILRLFDGARTLLNVVDDCGIADSEALSLAGKLFAEGIIRDVQAPAEETAAASPAAEGWLTEAAGPFRPPAVADDAEPPTGDGNDIHRRRTGPLEPLEPPLSAAPPPVADEPRRDTLLELAVPALEEPSAANGAPASVLNGAISTPIAAPASEEPPPADAADETVDLAPSAATPEAVAPTVAVAPDEPPPIAVSSGAIPGPRENEPAVVIPFGDMGGAARRTLLAAGGAPTAAANAADSGPLAAIAGSLGESMSPSARSTEPGIGPPDELSAGSPLADATAAEALLAGAEPFPSASDSTALPVKAARWTKSGDAVSDADALDELSLPGRHRGPLMLIGGAALLGGLVFAAQRLFPHGERATDRPALAAPVTPSEQAPRAVVVKEAQAPAKPALPPVPAPAKKPAAPAVELPTAPIAASPNPPGKESPPPAARAPELAARESPSAAAAAKSPSAAKPAVAAQPDRGADFSGLLEKCRAAFSQGKVREAATACAAAKDANGESGDALLLLAHVEFNRNHLKDALQWAEKAIKIDPNLADAYVIFGGVQQDAGRNREAKWAYKKYLELAPRGQYAADLRAIVDTL
ncbi:MAG TPA: DUF4388 domain-containing protein [Polyangia bacterium]|jgi:CheY-like chemotaxis protein/tetratricopeptide (TPR) repeat protein|nr:DUF4388 domain-containing protein [Polyangia bacterium]